MSVYEVTSPTGDTYEVTAPEGASEQEVLSYAQSQFGTQKPAWGDVIAGLPATRFAMGAVSPLLAAAQLNPLWRAPVTMGLQRYEEAKQRGMKAAKNEGFDWMGLAGQIAPSTAIAKGVTSALPMAKGLLGRIGTGMAAGAAVGATTPVTSPDNFGEQKALQTGIGAATGGAIPLGSAALSKGKEIVSPLLDLFRKGGEKNILTKYQKEILGPNVGNVRQALLQAKELVPGSKPTAAEAVAGLPEGSPIVAHQTITAKTPGGVSGQFGTRFREQQAAREGALQGIAKGVKSEESAIAARAKKSSPLYAQAFKEVVPVDQNLRQIIIRPSMKKALDQAEVIAKENGIIFPKSKDAIAVQKLHYAKLALDDMIKNPERFALGKSEERAILGTKEALTTWLDNASWQYGTARETFKKLSGPVNRVQVREALLGKLQSPTGTETPGTYLRAVDESAQMLKKSTGNARYKDIEQVLKPGEAKAARSVASDLERTLASKKPLQQTQLRSGGIDVTEGLTPHLPNMLSRPMMLANWLASKATGGIEPRLDAEAARRYLNPQLLAEALQDLPPQQRNEAMLQALRLLGTTVPTVYAGRSLNP